MSETSIELSTYRIMNIKPILNTKLFIGIEKNYSNYSNILCLSIVTMVFSIIFKVLFLAFE